MNNFWIVAIRSFSRMGDLLCCSHKTNTKIHDQSDSIARVNSIKIAQCCSNIQIFETKPISRCQSILKLRGFLKLQGHFLNYTPNRRAPMTFINGRQGSCNASDPDQFWYFFPRFIFGKNPLRVSFRKGERMIDASPICVSMHARKNLGSLLQTSLDGFCTKFLFALVTFFLDATECFKKKTFSKNKKQFCGQKQTHIFKTQKNNVR